MVIPSTKLTVHIIIHIIIIDKFLLIAQGPPPAPHASPLRRSPTSPHQLTQSPLTNSPATRGRRSSCTLSDDSDPVNSSPSRKVKNILQLFFFFLIFFFFFFFFFFFKKVGRLFWINFLNFLIDNISTNSNLRSLSSHEI